MNSGGLAAVCVVHGGSTHCGGVLRELRGLLILFAQASLWQAAFLWQAATLWMVYGGTTYCGGVLREPRGLHHLQDQHPLRAQCPPHLPR